jgi:hypothetical protein
MALAQQFQSMTASVFPSQNEEVVIAKQPVLADYGREVRSAINQLPPEVSRNLLAEYREPQPQLVAQLEEAIITRELAIENAAQGINLDQQWLQGANARRMDEVGISAGDEWNSP